ncbi:MAG TPA: hypothetical protein VK168_03135 [Saprospiraceae bacterium]|nr:hypothetical protein [Saprospiraceae bacterium]
MYYKNAAPMGLVGLRPILICFILKLACTFTHAQSPDGFFDPLRDPVAALVNNRLRLVVSEEVLVRSVSANMPQMGTVERVDRQFIENAWWLTIESRHSGDMEQSVFIAVRLKEGADQKFFADHYWTACTGEGCGGCDFKIQMDGCFCRFDAPGEPGTPGACYQTASDEMLLTKVHE